MSRKVTRTIRTPILALTSAALAWAGIAPCAAQPPAAEATGERSVALERLDAQRFATLADERVIVHGDLSVTAGELRAAARAAERSVRRMARASARANQRHLEYRRRVLARSLDRDRSLARAQEALAALRARGGLVAEPADGGGPVLKPIDDG